jgi:capsular polysaccharide biosynthesis protein
MQDKTNTSFPGYTPVRYASDITSDEIDLKDIIQQLWIRRKFILMTTFFSLLLGIFIATTSPIQYTAESVILPQSGRQSSAGNLSSLASVVGVNIGAVATAEGTISTTIYPQIINSLPYVREIMQTPITVEKSPEKRITLYEYYTDKRYKEVNVLTIIKKYTIGLPQTLVSAFRIPKKQKVISYAEHTSDSTHIARITAQEQAVFNTIKGAIIYEYNPREGVIRLGYKFPEAIAAAQVSQQLYKSLEKYVVTYKLEKVQENLAFVEQSYTEARKDFFQKQANLAAFQDANRGITTAYGRTIETRLRSEYDISFTIYNELAKQLEQTKLSVKEEKPVLTVINPVVVPLVKSAPSREKIIIIFMILGIAFATIWVLVKPFFQEIIRNVRD